MMNLLLFMFLAGQTSRIEGTEIYVPLRANQVALGPQGEVFILDVDESRVVFYDADGKRLGTFGQAGEGPGDLNRPSSIQRVGEKVYVMTMDQISIWDLKGGFQTAYKPFKMGARVFKADEGYLVLIRDFMGPNPPQLFRYNDDFSQKQELLTLEQSDMASMMSGKYHFNPAPSNQVLRFGPGGHTVFLKEKNGYHLRVLDGKTGAAVTEIKKEVELYPFDKDWGKARMEENKVEMKEILSRVKIEYVADFPDHFPALASVEVTPDGLLAVERFHLPDGKPLPLEYYDQKGQPAKSPFRTMVELERFLAVHQGRVYISTYDDDEAGMAVMKPEEAAAFIEANPIEFDHTAHWKAKLRSFQ